MWAAHVQPNLRGIYDLIVTGFGASAQVPEYVWCILKSPLADGDSAFLSHSLMKPQQVQGHGDGGITQEPSIC